MSLYAAPHMAKMSRVSLGECFQACSHALDRTLVLAACFTSSFDRIVGSSSSGRFPIGTLRVVLLRVGFRRPPLGASHGSAPGVISSLERGGLQWQTRLRLQRQVISTVATPSRRASSKIRRGRPVTLLFPIDVFTFQLFSPRNEVRSMDTNGSSVWLILPIDHGSVRSELCSSYSQATV
jgi:hypothetical protein